jgi:hypothetical protein
LENFVALVLTGIGTYSEYMSEDSEVWVFKKMNIGGGYLLLSRTFSPGMVFSRALSEVMHGSLHSNVHRMTLADELRLFQDYVENELTENESKTFDLIPCDDFATQEEYIDYLGSEGKCPGFSHEVNGGAQFLRLLHEIETYFRFIEINSNLTEREVIQSNRNPLTREIR